MNKALRIKNKGRLDQKGLASVVVVTVLVVLLTLISIGFARLMSRSVSNSTNNQLSAAANYGAQSGINDVIAYLQKNLGSNPDPESSSVNITTCNQLLDTTTNPVNRDTTKISAYFSGLNNTNEKYTCILVNSQPPEIFYQKIPADSSQVIKMTTTATSGNPVGSILLSWQSADNPPQNQFPSSGTSLLTESTWNGNKYAPILRVTLYPLANGDTTTINDSGAAIAAASRTYFLYPTSNAGATNSVGYATADGSLIATKCDNSTTPKSFANFGTSTFNCNLIITGLPAAGYFYVRLTPIYDQASVQIKANNTSNNAVKFVNVQAVADVTAKVNTASKRLRARVELNGSSNVPAGSNNVPESSLRTASALCKRLQLNPPNVQVDSTVCAAQLAVNNPPPPTTCQDPGATNVGGPLPCTYPPPTCSGVTLYEGNDYGGPSDTYTSDAANFFGRNVDNDQASSINVPANCAVTIYQHIDYGGYCDVYTSSSSSLIHNNDASSLRFGNYGPCGGGDPGDGDCFDGIQNGDETGVDTGGRCGDPIGGPGSPWLEIYSAVISSPVHYNPNVDQRFCPDGVHHYVICGMGAWVYEHNSPDGQISYCQLRSNGTAFFTLNYPQGHYGNPWSELIYVENVGWPYDPGGWPYGLSIFCHANDGPPGIGGADDAEWP